MEEVKPTKCKKCYQLQAIRSQNVKEGFIHTWWECKKCDVQSDCIWELLSDFLHKKMTLILSEWNHFNAKKIGDQLTFQLYTAEDPEGNLSAGMEIFMKKNIDTL